MPDPWATDWGDDWSKPAPPIVSTAASGDPRSIAASNGSSSGSARQKSSVEQWADANRATAASHREIAEMAPQVAYRPAVRILKRDNGSNATERAAREQEAAAARAARGQAEVAGLTREEQYRLARERLFGAGDGAGTGAGAAGTEAGAAGASRSGTASPIGNKPSFATHKLEADAIKVHKPERQSRGPDSSGRGGFASRGRGRVT